MNQQFPVGLQLYTVRDHLSRDYRGTLARIAEMGYRHIEMGGFGPFGVGEWNEVLRQYGLSVCANHIQIEMLEESFSHIAEFNEAIGNRRLVCPYLREERRSDLADYRRTAGTLNSLGRLCRDRGFEFYYHNHAFEFTDLGGTCGFEVLTAETDPELVQFELDTYWVAFGGQDPADWIARLKGRCGVLHLKDMDAKDRKVFREVGEGVLDFEGILSAARTSGTKLLVVEQDLCPTDSLACAHTSIRNIRRLQGLTGAGER